MSKYKNGVKIVRFPGGRVARFHKPGTKAYRSGVAKRKRAGRMLAKKFGFAKRRRNPGKYVRRSRVYDPFSRRMVRTKPIKALMGGGVKKYKGRRGHNMARGADGVWSRPNPDNIRTGRPRAVRAPSFIYHSSTPASLRNKWVVIGTDYGYLHNSGGEIRTWKTRSGAAAAAKKYVSLSGIPTRIGSNPRASKTKIVYVIQGSYGYYGSHGWEDENEETTFEDAKRSLKEYRENGPGSYRLIRRRVPIESNPRGHRGSRKKSRSPARRLLNKKRDFGFQQATTNRWAHAVEMDEAAANSAFLRAYKKRNKKYKRNPQEAFNVYRKGRLIDTVFATGYTADEMKRSLINHDGYPSDIRVTKRKAKR